MSGFTRVTLVGSGRRSDVAVPDDEPLGALLPRLLDLLDEPVGRVSRPLSLVRLDGAGLDLASSAERQELRPGEVIRIVHADQAPPPPEVAQVTDVLGASSGARTDRWTDATRAHAGIVALGILAAVSVLLGAGPLAVALTPGAARLVPIVVAAAAGAVAVGGALARWPWGVAAATAVSVGAGVPGATLAALPDRPSAAGWALPVVIAAGLLGWICLGTCVGLLLGRPAVVAGAAVGVLVLLVPVVAAGLGPTAAAAVGAVVGVLTLGLLPRFALSVAGLPRLEDDALRGELSPWEVVQGAVDLAHTALTWSVVAVSVGLAATAGTLASASSPWALGLVVAVLLVTALRARAFPLIAQHVALWLVVVVAIGLGLLSRWGALSLGALAGVAGGLGLLAVALAVVRPPDHVRATLRRVGDVTELLAVVTLAPLLLGVLGIYADLLERFR